MPTANGKTYDQQQREMELAMIRTAQKFERRIAREIARAMRDLARAINEGSAVKRDAAMNKHRKRLDRLIVPLWVDAGKSTQDSMQDTQKSRGLRLEIKQTFDVEGTPTANKIVSDWLIRWGGIKITQIADTTLNDVRAIISDGVDQGLSERAIAKMINAIAPTKSASRSQTIARTEAHQAANVTAAATAKASGLALKKRWSASKGERTRHAHREADGQTVAQDQPFIVDGEGLMFPGDPRGRASNVINCRCMVLYVLA